MAQLSKNKWAKLNDFLLSIGSARSIEELNAGVLEEIQGLIRFQNSGVLIELDNLKPTIHKSVRTEHKWIDLFNDYYYTISTYPDFDKNIFSANFLDLKKHHKHEYVNDFLVPQKICYSTGFIVFDNERKPAYTLVLNRAKTECMFSPEELTVMKIIQPHVTNYYKMHFLLEQFRKMPVLISELERDNHVLSARESEILYLLLQRLKPADIAIELTISVLTVRKHIQNIYEKLKVADRKQLFQKIHYDFKKND